MQIEITKLEVKPVTRFVDLKAGRLFTFHSDEVDNIYMVLADEADVSCEPYMYVDLSTGRIQHIDDMQREYHEEVTDVTEQFKLKGEL